MPETIASYVSSRASGRDYPSGRAGPGQGPARKQQDRPRSRLFGKRSIPDADTVVLGNLSFDPARGCGLRLLERCICECPWARRYAGIQGEAVEYNTGVLFFSEQAKPVFETWARLAPQTDSFPRRPPALPPPPTVSASSCRITIKAHLPRRSKRRNSRHLCCRSIEFCPQWQRCSLVR